MIQAYRRLVVPLLILVPALMVGGFEYIRHELFVESPVRTGNLLAAAVAVIGSLIYYLVLYRYIQGLARHAEQERLERAVRERQAKIAEDLHDEILQNLFFINVQIGEAKARAAAAGMADIGRSLESIGAAVRETHARMRSTIEALEQVENSKGADPGRRDDWLPSLMETVLTWQEQNGMPVQIELGPMKGVRLRRRQAEAMCSVVWQALQNVRKHANATRVEIRGQRCRDGVEWTISDNGRGFDVQAAEPHFGFRKMQRVERELGIQVRIASRIGSGTRVTVRVPVGESTS